MVSLGDSWHSGAALRYAQRGCCRQCLAEFLCPRCRLCQEASPRTIGFPPVQPRRSHSLTTSTIELAAKIFSAIIIDQVAGRPVHQTGATARDDERGIDREAIWRVGLFYDHVPSIGAGPPNSRPELSATASLGQANIVGWVRKERAQLSVPIPIRAIGVSWSHPCSRPGRGDSPGRTDHFRF